MNVINVIEPYRYLGMWVFDDVRVGLEAEPFVGGADTLIDHVTADISNAAEGFVMVFARIPFPGHQFQLDWRREDGTGNVYHSKDFDAEGWLCPALLRYFEVAPPSLFVQIKPKPKA